MNIELQSESRQPETTSANSSESGFTRRMFVFFSSFQHIIEKNREESQLSKFFDFSQVLLLFKKIIFVRENSFPVFICSELSFAALKSFFVPARKDGLFDALKEGQKSPLLLPPVEVVAHEVVVVCKSKRFNEYKSLQGVFFYEYSCFFPLCLVPRYLDSKNLMTLCLCEAVGNPTETLELAQSWGTHMFRGRTI